MGKTHRRLPIGFLRSPRGRKQALIQGCRYKAIPPDGWDDIPAQKEAMFPYDIARRFHVEGMPREVAIRKLRKRFRLTQREAEAVTYRWTWKNAESYAQDVYDSLAFADKVLVRLRYGKDIRCWHEQWLANGRRYLIAP
jgi:hypothetical protein